MPRAGKLQAWFNPQGDYPTQWRAVISIAAQFGCTAETIRGLVRQVEFDPGRPDGMTNDERARIRDVERENRELRRANEILRKAPAYFPQAAPDRKQGRTTARASRWLAARPNA